MCNKLLKGKLYIENVLTIWNYTNEYLIEKLLGFYHVRFPKGKDVVNMLRLSSRIGDDGGGGDA